jgi:hypothetical protein
MAEFMSPFTFKTDGPRTEPNPARPLAAARSEALCLAALPLQDQEYRRRCRVLLRSKSLIVMTDQALSFLTPNGHIHGALFQVLKGLVENYRTTRSSSSENGSGVSTGTVINFPFLIIPTPPPKYLWLFLRGRAGPMP